jgi:hypothetical protein
VIAVYILASIAILLGGAACYVAVKIAGEERAERQGGFMDPFGIGGRVVININLMAGTVIGVGDFKLGGRQYSVEYPLPSGEIKTNWFPADELTPAEAPKEGK